MAWGPVKAVRVASEKGGVRSILAPILLLSLASAAAAGTWVWVDERGVTHITDDPETVPEVQRTRPIERGDDLRDLWNDVEGPAPPVRAGAGGAADARVDRLVRGAIADLSRGENARATAALRGVLRARPAHPEAHWYTALLDRRRGRWDSSEAHLRAFLAGAGDAYDPWRASAERRLAALADERRLADETRTRNPQRWVGLASPHFRVNHDSELAEASPDYADTVLRFLEDARENVGRRLGVLPEQPLGVMFYGKAAYLEATRHRFSFQTVGFFDGRIHVVSAAHPGGELRSLLFQSRTPPPRSVQPAH